MKNKAGGLPLSFFNAALVSPPGGGSGLEKDAAYLKLNMAPSRANPRYYAHTSAELLQTSDSGSGASPLSVPVYSSWSCYA